METTHSPARRPHPRRREGRSRARQQPPARPLPSPGLAVYSFSERKLWSRKLCSVFPAAMTDTITSQLRSTFRNRLILPASTIPSHKHQTTRYRSPAPSRGSRRHPALPLAMGSPFHPRTTLTSGLPPPIESLSAREAGPPLFGPAHHGGGGGTAAVVGDEAGHPAGMLRLRTGGRRSAHTQWRRGGASRWVVVVTGKRREGL